MYLRKKLNQEGGFTLAEIFVAGLIMAVALIPIVRMFDTSFSGIRAMESLQGGEDCAKAAIEQIKSMPLYEPYNPDFGDVDIDDSFWGIRNPVTYNPGAPTPDWVNIPEVAFYDYGGFSGYENFRVGIRLSYLDNGTSPAVLEADWGPKTVGKDRPTDSDSKSIHLLLVQLNVYWVLEGVERSYTLETIVTDTEAIYDLGISDITVLGPSSIMDPNHSNAAAHWPDAVVQVEIKGWGFNTDAAALLKASLVRDRNTDIPITITSKTSEIIRGTVNLYSTGTDISDEVDWYPRAAIGYWSVKVNQEAIFSTYLYNGFIVEYPKPVITDFGNASDMSKTGLNWTSNASLKVTGGPFVYKVKKPAARLIRYGENNEILNQLDGTDVAVTPINTTYGYGSTGYTITATFNLTKGDPGEYHMYVVNTDDATLAGHVQSNPSVAVYTIIEVKPQVDDAYINGSSPVERRVYRNVGNPWRLRIVGNYFNLVGSPPVDVYLCSEVVGEAPAGNYVQGTNIGMISSQAFLADFNLSSLPEGNYKVFVRNRNDNKVGWTAGAPITLLTFNANIGGFTPNSGYSFYENYYDILCKITGNGLSGVTKVTIISTTTTTTEYDITNECTFTSDNEIAVKLNLIDCSNARSWKVREYFVAGYYLEQAFTVALGPAKILPADNTKNAISIYREGRSRTASWSYETVAAKAQAWETTGFFSTAYATFTVQGMGFPVSGTTTLRIYRGTTTDRTATCTTVTDRANKIVKIVSPRWQMVNVTVPVDCGISVQRGTSAEDKYDTRWTLID